MLSAPAPDHLGCPPLGSPLYIPNWRYYCRCSFTSVWAKDSAADWLAVLLLTDPSMWPPLFVETAHCWLILNLLSTVSPQSFPANLLFIQLTTQPILGHGMTTSQMQHFTFFEVHGSCQLVSPACCFLSKQYFNSPAYQLFSLIWYHPWFCWVSSVLSFKSWMKTLNRWAPLLHYLDAARISCCS